MEIRIRQWDTLTDHDKELLDLRECGYTKHMDRLYHVMALSNEEAVRSLRLDEGAKECVYMACLYVNRDMKIGVLFRNSPTIWFPSDGREDIIKATVHTECQKFLDGLFPDTPDMEVFYAGNGYLQEYATTGRNMFQ